ncbi:MAG: outer membrane protein assembly factor BamC, partial [Burkholderiales bacterium]
MRSIALIFISAAVVAGCSGSLSERNKIDYKSAGRLPPLEVPPDLAAPQADDRFAVPEAGSATYSAYS